MRVYQSEDYSSSGTASTAFRNLDRQCQETAHKIPRTASEVLSSESARLSRSPTNLFTPFFFLMYQETTQKKNSATWTNYSYLSYFRLSNAELPDSVCVDSVIWPAQAHTPEPLQETHSGSCWGKNWSPRSSDGSRMFSDLYHWLYPAVKARWLDQLMVKQNEPESLRGETQNKENESSTEPQPLRCTSIKIWRDR